ncbi:hypothetical protein [Kocuria sp.]|uniref:hypothetical protein n=1 Tax=Kocuria sp. TaxID=1871328 RepID=UPI0026DD0D5A|nr:hypothetical protein [Kocuria sp.]MDO4919567.1 hypothetical protein [Kocuria sp.]
MSSHATAPRRRALPLTALCLAAALVAVLAVGAWAHWRPLSDDDAARLRARATVDAVRTGVRHDSRLLTDEILTRQLDALGPAATPAQQHRLDEREDTAATLDSLDDAADQLARTATTSADGDLAATAGAIAASWWAASPQGGGRGAGSPVTDGAASPAPSTGAATAGAAEEASPVPGAASPTRGADHESPGSPDCGTDLTAALTALDRAGYVAQAAGARLGEASGGTAENAAEVADRALEDRRVLPLLTCAPPPAGGFYRLPDEFERDPARAAGRAQREAGEALVRALAASSPGDVRAWTVTALRETARTAQTLDPQQPVAALPGRS